MHAQVRSTLEMIIGTQQAAAPASKLILEAEVLVLLKATSARLEEVKSMSFSVIVCYAVSPEV